MARTVVQTDDFTRAEMDSNWEQLHPGTCRVDLIGSNHVEGSHGAGTIAESGAARWIGSGDFTNDQYAQITLLNIGSGSAVSRMGVIVRASGDLDGASDFYTVFIEDDNQTTWRLGKVVDGTWTELATGSQAWTDGDIISLEVVGSTVIAFRNANPLAQEEDSTLSIGQPGIIANVLSTLQGDSWEAGSMLTVEVAGFRRLILTQ